MFDSRNAFSSSPALGSKVKPATPAAAPPAGDEPFTVVDVGSAPLARFTVVCRDGRVWSYPYAYVGLIDCPAGDRLVVHGSCGAVKTIEFKGCGLRQLAELMAVGRVQTVLETSHPAFAKEQSVVTQVTITAGK